MVPVNQRSDHTILWISTALLGGAVLYILARSILSKIPRQGGTMEHSVRKIETRMPRAWDTMTNEQLTLYNRDKPVQFLRKGGGRLILQIDAASMQLPDILCTLRGVRERYPQVSSIKISHYSGDGSELVGAIASYECLSRLSFRACTNLTPGTITAILEKNRTRDRLDQTIRIKQLHLRGSTSLPMSFCRGIAQKYRLVMTFPDHKSNYDEMLEKFYSDLRRESTAFLLEIISERKRTAPVPAVLERFETLLGQRVEKQTFLNAFREVQDLLDPTTMGQAELWTLEESMKKKAEKIVDREDIAVIDNPFSLNLRRVIVTDAMLSMFVARLQRLNAYLTELDVSESLLTGEVLRKLKGLPIQKIVARSMKKLSPGAMNHLSELTDLRVLDASGSPVTDNNVYQGIRESAKLSVLKLRHCTISAEALLSVIPIMISRALECLSLDHVPSVTQEMIDRFVHRGEEDPSKPFIVTSTVGGKRRMDISKVLPVDVRPAIDERLFSAMKQVEEKDDPIQVLRFGEGSRLEVRDLEKLDSLGFVKPVEFFFRKIDMSDDSITWIATNWPIKLAHFTAGKVEVDQPKVAITGTEISKKISSLLEGLSGITELRFSIQSFGSNEEARKQALTWLAGYCERKQIRTLTIVGSNLQKSDFQDAISNPKEPFRRLLAVCTKIRFERGHIDGLLDEESREKLEFAGPFHPSPSKQNIAAASSSNVV